MPNVKLTLSYDGTDFFGFQDNNSGRTVEGELKRALFQIFQTPFPINGASRTDRGVHARGQVVNVFLPKMVSDLQYHLNRLLPKDLVITNLEEVPDDFHATIDALSKEYHYNVSFGSFQDPFLRRTHWHFPMQKIDERALQEAISLLLTLTDFAPFTRTKKLEVYASSKRSLSRLELIFEGDQLRIEMVGQKFLYHMARILSGTLLHIACGKLSRFSEKISGGDRSLLGVTAPPHGLTLHKIFYG